MKSAPAARSQSCLAGGVSPRRYTRHTARGRTTACQAVGKYPHARSRLAAAPFSARLDGGCSRMTRQSHPGAMTDQPWAGRWGKTTPSARATGHTRGSKANADAGDCGATAALIRQNSINMHSCIIKFIIRGGTEPLYRVFSLTLQPETESLCKTGTTRRHACRPYA